MSPSTSLDLFGGPSSGDAAHRKSLTSLGRLMGDIAATREEILRKEAFIAALEARLHGEMGSLEKKFAKVRLETFRILVEQAREGRLRKKPREKLIDVLCEFAEDLEAQYGLDVSKDMQSILPELDFEDLPAEFKSPPADGAGSASHGERTDSSGHPGGGGSGRKREAKSKAETRRETEEITLAGEIRALYLLLARALHPDKESDAARVAEKTAWMQKVTAAYGSRNLAQLLDILARNPLDAVGPYLSQAPAKTVQGFAKRLRRELDALRRQVHALGGNLHPLFADFVEKERVDEAAYRRYLGQLKSDLRIHKERRDAYRNPDAVLEMIALLDKYDWRNLM